MAGGTVDVAPLADALRVWGVRTRKATEAGVKTAGTELKGEIQANLVRLEYPPASPPGEPPALRSGNLRDRVHQRTVELARGYQERVFPSAVYARIHELSGWAGAGHRSFLPKRPYVGPALEAYKLDFRSEMSAAWSAALPGR